jgi:two-component system, OmpR family, phosphate regulon sensor histidine kinase PhoR
MPMPEKVLVVDDSQDIREFLNHYILKPKGFEVIMAVNGMEGLELATSHLPDLIICDNQMPRMSGLEMIRELRERGLHIPTILTTAFGSEERAVEAFRLGVRDYVIKPFDTYEMTSVVERALRESRLERERDALVQQLTQSNGQLARRVQELNTLYNISKSVTSSLNLKTVLHRVVDAAVFITAAEEGSLMLLDSDQGELYVRASKNLDSATRSMRLQVQDSLAGQVIASKRPLVIGDDARWQKIKTAYLVKSLIYVPLIAQDNTLGVLSVVNRFKNSIFDAKETRILSALADYAAMAIHNADLYSQTDSDRNQLSTILRQTDDPVLVVDLQGRLQLVNEAARLALELPRGELLQQPLQALTGNEDLLTFLKRPDGFRFNHYGEIAVNDGRIFNVNVTLIEGIGRSIVMRDITQLKELDQLKSEFVSVVSHDLRSPLTAILGYVQLLERAGPLNEAQKEFVTRVQQNVSNITSLITDLLDLGRLEAGLDLTLTECLAGEILQEIVAELQPSLAAKQLELNLSLHPSVAPVLGDRNRLHQTYSNILTNAIKYTPECGAVSVELVEQDGQVIVRITDTGLGIPPADQPYIFDKFFRASNVTNHYEGTGLGLSIVKSVVERHYGRIWVSSELNRGSTFTIVLPTIQQHTASSDHQSLINYHSLHTHK